MKKNNKFIIILIICVFIAIDFVLRFCFGFCDALLYQSSDRYEYIAQPNQERLRFGVRLKTNSYSQRSEEPDSTKMLNSIKIVFLIFFQFNIQVQKYNFHQNY